MVSRSGASSPVVTMIVGLVLVLAALFMWQVWKYYDKITSGQAADLPQFAAAFTSASGATSALAGAHPEVATDDDPSIGPKDAKLTVVEFLDYQCPYCAEEFPVFRSLTSAYGDRVRFIVRDFPVLELHPDALKGAEAAGCAEAQGKFWAMHDHLFALKGSLAADDLARAAEQSGLDTQAFKACMDGHDRLDEIQKDAADGVAAGVRGTPTFFINGNKVEGAIPQDAFERIIKAYATP